MTAVSGTAGHEGPEGSTSEAASAGDEGLQAELSAARAESAQLRDQYVRAVAELENVRKRSQRDVEQAHRYALERFLQDLLPVKDSLDLAVENAERADLPALLEGQAATLRLLSKALESAGVTEVNPLGAPFDANLHEAMAAQPSATAEPDSVLAVVQRGYTLNGRLLRAARVIVARSA